MSRTDYELVRQIFGHIELRYRLYEPKGDEEDLLGIRQAHGIPEDVDVERGISLVTGDVLFFGPDGDYVGLGSAYAETPMFWRRSETEARVNRPEGSMLHVIE